MNDLILNIYDDSGKTVVKTFKASTCDLMFRTVRKLMDLLKIEDMDNQVQMLKTIYSAWGEICVVLAGVFPEVSAEDWDNVRVRELLPLVLKIAKYSISEMFVIPTDETKN